MHKIRLGKEFSVRWGLILNGQPAELDKIDVKVILINPFGKRSNLGYTVDRNVLVIPVERTLQSMTGAYSLSLWINKDKDGQTVVDCNPAFCLVTSTDEESCAQIQVIKEVLDLGTSEIQLGVQGKSAYQTWLDEGNEGTEQDFLNWLRQPSTEAGTEAQAAAAKAAEAAAKADKAAESANTAASEAVRIASESASQSEQRVTTAIESLNQSVTLSEQKVSEAVSKAEEATAAAQSAAESATASSAKAEASSSKADASKAEADKAAAAAQTATQNANTAKQGADSAAARATESAGRADAAAQSVNTAISNAAAATDKATASSAKADSSAAKADAATTRATTAAQKAEDMTAAGNKVLPTLEGYKDHLDKITTEYNVSVFHPTSGTGKSNRYTLATAIVQVPEGLRAPGLVVSFLNESNKVEKWEYRGGAWAVSSFKKPSGEGNMILPYKTDVATTRKQVQESERVPGMQISYKGASGWVNEQYIGTAVTDAEWVKDANWEQVANIKQVIELNDKLQSVEDIAYSGEKSYSPLHVAIETAGGSAWYSSKAFPDINTVSGFKINSRTEGTIDLAVLNKEDKSSKILCSVKVKKGIGEYITPSVYNIDTKKDCFYISNAKNSYSLFYVKTEDILPVVTGGGIDVSNFKGEVLVQLVSRPNIGEKILALQSDAEDAKAQFSKFPPIEEDIKILNYKVKDSIFESGRCGDFNFQDKVISSGTNRYYIRFSLGEHTDLTISSLSGFSIKDLVFFSLGKFAFFIRLADNSNDIHVEPIVRFMKADSAVLITNKELSIDNIILSGVLKKQSLSEVSSGNCFSSDNTIARSIHLKTVFGLQVVPSYAPRTLVPVIRDTTYYHNGYMVWNTYSREGNFVAEGSGYGSVNIESGSADFLMVETANDLSIISTDSELVKSKFPVPSHLPNLLSGALDDDPYKALSNQGLNALLKNFIADKYAGKSVFFVGDSYAAGDLSKEYRAYSHDFAIRHPLADVQNGGGYIWSGRTISTYTPDNILKSVLSICKNFGYSKIPEEVNFSEAKGLEYTTSILFQDVTELDRLIYNAKTGQFIIYSVNKGTYGKTELKRIGTINGVAEFVFRHKIKALEGECIGIEHTAGIALKSSSSNYTKIDGSSSQGEVKLQVCLNRCNYLIYEGGLNDMYSRSNVPFGSLLGAEDYTTDTFDDSTFCGALEHMVRESVMKLTATKLGFLIMPQPGDAVWNGQYAKAIKDVCDKYGVPYLDMGDMKRMEVGSKGSMASRDFWCTNPDGSFNMHPSALGYSIIMNDAINTFIDSL